MDKLTYEFRGEMEARMDLKGEKVLTSLVGDFAGGTPVLVHVKDDRIIRIRPMIFGEDEAKPWKIKVGNRIFTPPKRTNPAPYRPFRSQARL